MGTSVLHYRICDPSEVARRGYRQLSGFIDLVFGDGLPLTSFPDSLRDKVSPFAFTERELRIDWRRAFRMAGQSPASYEADGDRRLNPIGTAYRFRRVKGGGPKHLIFRHPHGVRWPGKNEDVYVVSANRVRVGIRVVGRAEWAFRQGFAAFSGPIAPTDDFDIVKLVYRACETDSQREKFKAEFVDNWDPVRSILWPDD